MDEKCRAIDSIGMLPIDRHRIAARATALVQLLAASARRTLCALRGHERVLHFESNRLSLRCLACGAETPGWQLDARPDLRRHRPRFAVSTIVRPTRA